MSLEKKYQIIYDESSGLYINNQESYYFLPSNLIKTYGYLLALQEDITGPMVSLECYTVHWVFKYKNKVNRDAFFDDLRKNLDSMAARLIQQ